MVLGLVDSLNTGKMKYISLNGEQISFFSSSRRVIVFDLLYSEQLFEKNYLFNDSELTLSQVESLIFEWGSGNILGEYYMVDSCKLIEIDVCQIKNVTDEIDFGKVFSTDSGLICIVDFSHIQKLLTHLTYDDFVDSLNIGGKNINQYIESIVKEVGTCFSIISTPGIDRGFDFDGSGSYYIDSHCF